VDRVVAVGIGSNLGDRHSHITYARTRLQALLSDLLVSAIRETDPVGVPADSQPPYLNAVAVGTSDASPRELLDGLLAIERERGRERPYLNAPRTLDLDLLLVGDVVIGEPDLVLPHPRLRERLFVLEPLAEVAPRWRHPLTGKTAEQMLIDLRPIPPSPSTNRP
jgi:2-amino-4-hydroxy-6-hydroxymethyldihydropteridine diphosphokinase